MITPLARWFIALVLASLVMGLALAHAAFAADRRPMQPVRVSAATSLAATAADRLS